MKLFLVFSLLISVLLACDVRPEAQISSPSVSLSSVYSGSTPPLLNTWSQWAPGLEIRYERWKSAGNNEDTVVITRFDLQHVRISVGYQPDQPLSLNDWVKQTGALAVINGGFFDAKNHPVALLISNGQSYGTSYGNFGGMFSIDSQGGVSLRSLRDQPYDPYNEQLQQATQSSPMLMIAGQRTQFQADASTQRRSVIAMDKQGHLLLIVSPSQAFSLDELADLLISSDLSLQTAMNLDGGASSGLYVNSGSQKVTVSAFTLLPIAIIIK